ncbi:serine hydrolase domain-containing protein [Paenibacillus mucilaginosus]|uniref:Beta-lactamase n=1 Tax=Paenibacillus mucilaginosus (strain KNP414) TaxID=1036673 RepID=F8F6U7_PAEMK|nr:serine hydrolase domain-containing protein [Paenibacillus mucilaginosus]AEI43613.1 beta-lactamase [Paenibacillus mucilaginosus KNP414]MCG7216737.1 beta-lactamase family protein [Paenibacillus mucilaginosus]WDM25147.1 beta-lactamase family protein [Paenibacillus mucilaginosus]
MKRMNRLTELMQGFVEKGPAGCACSVSKEGELLYQDYAGYANLERREPITEDTVYRIFSMTKVVTCAAALILYERGRFLLNDPLHEYLPEFKNPQVFVQDSLEALSTVEAKRPIRVKDLFAMTSGLTYGGERTETERRVKLWLEGSRQRAEKLDARSLSRALAAIPLAFEPGTRWQYGFSHDVLGALIEVISGRTLGQFMQEEIFGPLGMKDTSFKLTAETQGRLCTHYNRAEDGTLTPSTQFDEPYGPDSRFESGGAGLLSTIGDYSRFAQMLALGGEWNGERILSSGTVRLMAANQLSPVQLQDYNWSYLEGFGYGLGVRTLMDPAAAGSNASVGEFGWSGLAGTWVMIDPKEKLSAVYMQQMLPNFEAVHQPRLRNVIYGALQ